MPMDPDYTPACTYCDDRGCGECEISIHLQECHGCERCEENSEGK